MKCGYEWLAPYLLPPDGKKQVKVLQECWLEKGHEGPHRSITNVITEQKEKQ